MDAKFYINVYKWGQHRSRNHLQNLKLFMIRKYSQIYFVIIADVPLSVKTIFLKFILILSAALKNWRVTSREHVCKICEVLRSKNT